MKPVGAVSCRQKKGGVKEAAGTHRVWWWLVGFVCTEDGEEEAGSSLVQARVAKAAHR